MPDFNMVVLSAGILGLSVAGSLLSANSGLTSLSRGRLIGVSTLLTLLAIIPLIITYQRGLYAHYMAATLPVLLAIPPALRAYIQSLTLSDVETRSSPRLWILPLFGVLVTLGYWALPAPERDQMFLNGELPKGLGALGLVLSTITLILLWIVTSLFDVIRVLQDLKAYRNRLKDRYSNILRLEMSWIEWLMGSVGGLWVMVALTLISDNFGPGLLFPSEWVLCMTGGVLLFLFISRPAPMTPEAADSLGAINGRRHGSLDNSPYPNTPTEKYARSPLDEAQAERLIARLKTAMSEDHLYLDPNLSLQKLSRHVSGAPNRVSQVLNERLGTTFFDYVAHWRIRAAIPKVRLGEQTMLEITMDVGFNSKSTFYKAFKRETGLTPTAFKAASESGAKGDTEKFN